MQNRRLILTYAVAMLVTVSCGNATFFGSSREGSPSPAPSPANPANPNGGTNNPNGSPTNPGGSNPGGSNPGGSNPGGSNSSIPGSSTSNPVGGMIYPGTGTNYPSGSIPSGWNPPGPIPVDPNCNCQPGPNNQVIIGPGGQVSNPSNQIIFGTTSTFHIGDGQFDYSSCKAMVASLPVLGIRYVFQFQVQNDNTVLNINVGSICGVDYPTNKIALYSGSTLIQPASMAIPIGNSSVPSSFASQAVTVNHGVYSYIVLSGLSPDGSGDYDDFIFGNVSIQANNSVTYLRYWIDNYPSL